LFLSVRIFPECPKFLGINDFFSTFIRCSKLLGRMKIFKMPKIFSISIFPECPNYFFNFYNISWQKTILKLLKFFQASSKFFLPNLFEHQDFSSSQIFKQKWKIFNLYNLPKSSGSIRILKLLNSFENLGKHFSGIL
jgi:hypothetical protein